MTRTLLGALCLGAIAAGCRSSQEALIPPASAQRPAENAALNSSRRTAVVDAASRVAPAVVSITV